MYEFAAILRIDELPDTPLLPQVTRSGFAYEDDETTIASAEARALTLSRGNRRYFRIRKVPVALTLTDRRVVVVCRKYRKGGSWGGNPVLAITFTIAAKAIAAARRHGKALGGHMRLEWITAIEANPTGRVLVLSAVDASDGQPITVRVELARGQNLSALTDQLLAAVIANRASGDPAHDRRWLDDVALDPKGNRGVAVRIPGATPAGSDTLGAAQVSA